MIEVKFDEHVALFVSERDDGNMKGTAIEATGRAAFLQKAGVEAGRTAYMKVDYSLTDFTKYYFLDDAGEFALDGAWDSVPSSDGFVTETSGIGLFLPIADCLGLVLYDVRLGRLMLVHSGRHNLEQDGAGAAARFLLERGSVAGDLRAWFSPCAGAVNYPVLSRGGKGLPQLATEQLEAEGVRDITSIGIDTTTDGNYFSNSQGDLVDRFAVLAFLK